MPLYSSNINALLRTWAAMREMKKHHQTHKSNETPFYLCRQVIFLAYFLACDPPPIPHPNSPTSLSAVCMHIALDSSDSFYFYCGSSTLSYSPLQFVCHDICLSPRALAQPFQMYSCHFFLIASVCTAFGAYNSLPFVRILAIYIVPPSAEHNFTQPTHAADNFLPNEKKKPKRKRKKAYLNRVFFIVDDVLPACK